MLAKVAAIIEETPQTKIFDLVSASDIALLPHTAGAHISVQVKLPDGLHDRRCYSVVNPPSYGGFYQLAVQREKAGRGGSAYMHDQLRVGDLIEIDEPKNHFPLAKDAVEFLFIAGGIGVTPILCMAKTLVIENRCFSLHYSARAPDVMAFKKEVVGVCGDRATLWFDGGDPGKGMDLQKILSKWREGLHVYTCGPAGLIDSVLAVTRSNGWPESAVHFELFNNPLAAQDSDKPIEIVLQHSGVTLQVNPGTSILDTLLAAGIDADYDCKVGECGSCLTTVLQGTPLHRDYYLNAKERAECTSMCTCVSWAKSTRLILDL